LKRIKDKVNVYICFFVVGTLIYRIEVISEVNHWYMQKQETPGWEDCYSDRSQHRSGYYEPLTNFGKTSFVHLSACFSDRNNNC
jgi:hypothetical protein